MNEFVDLVGGEIILLYNPAAMKKMLNIFLVGVFASAWIYTGGVSVRYPVLERVLANIDRQLPTDIAREIRLHTDASNMCGVHAVADVNKQSLHSNNLAAVANVSLPIAQFVLIPSLVHNFIPAASISLESAAADEIVPPPPLLTA